MITLCSQMFFFYLSHLIIFKSPAIQSSST